MFHKKLHKLMASVKLLAELEYRLDCFSSSLGIKNGVDQNRENSRFPLGIGTTKESATQQGNQRISRSAVESNGRSVGSQRRSFLLSQVPRQQHLWLRSKLRGLRTFDRLLCYPYV